MGDSRARQFVGDGSFPWNPDRRAELAEVHQLGDVVLLRYALSDRFDGTEGVHDAARTVDLPCDEVLDAEA